MSDEISMMAACPHCNGDPRHNDGRDCEIDALRAEVERLKREDEANTRELHDICNALPGVAFMDPPDGGSVTIAEQVRRMYAALLARDADVRALRDFLNGTPEEWAIRELEAYDEGENDGYDRALDNIRNAKDQFAKETPPWLR